MFDKIMLSYSIFAISAITYIGYKTYVNIKELINATDLFENNYQFGAYTKT